MARERGAAVAELLEVLHRLASILPILGGAAGALGIARHFVGNPLSQARAVVHGPGEHPPGADQVRRQRENQLEKAQLDLAEAAAKARAALLNLAEAEERARQSGTNSAHSISELETLRARHRRALFEHGEAAGRIADLQEPGVAEALPEALPTSSLEKFLHGFRGGGGGLGQLLGMGGGGGGAAAAGEAGGMVGLGSAAAAAGPIALLAMAAKAQMDRQIEGAKQVGGGLFGVASDPNDRVSGIGANLREMADGMGKLNPVFENTVGPIVRFTAGLLETVDRLRDTGQALLEMNFRFAKFSGSMAAVQAEHDIRGMVRDINSGEARASSTADLQRSLDDLNDTMAPLENEIANFKSEVMSKIIDIADTLLRPLVTSTTNILHLINEFLPKRKGDEVLPDWVQDFANQARPPRFR